MNPTFRLSGTDHTFAPLEGPIDQLPRHPLTDEIGHAMLAFSRLEYIVTALVMHINKAADSPELHDPDPVAKFKALVKLLRKWLTKHPRYAEFADPSDDVFFKALADNADLRNELSHSFLEAIDPETGDFKMYMLKRVGKDAWLPSTTTYKVETARFLAKQATLATRHFVEIAKQVFPTDDGEQPQTP